MYLAKIAKNLKILADIQIHFRIRLKIDTYYKYLSSQRLWNN